ncbi:MAG: PD-(D/E)XK nuclease superfamily protein [Nannocystaceae bacterium]
MSGHAYRDRVAKYIHDKFAPHGLVVYTEVPLGKTIIGKRRRLDIFVRHETTSMAMGIECKFQASSGTTDEKIPYALADLEAMWIPGCLVYAGRGWSAGVLHTLEGSRNAVYCDPGVASGKRNRPTAELDHVLASVFGLWSIVLPEKRRYHPKTPIGLPTPDFKRVAPAGQNLTKATKASS